MIEFPSRLGRWRAFWQPPVPALLSAGTTGERLVAGARLVVAVALGLIAWIAFLRTPGPAGAGIGVAALGGVGAAALALRATQRHQYEPRTGFITSILDVTLVSAVLAALLALGQSPTGVGGRGVFLLYFLAIAAAGLRFDPRICAVSGATAIMEYLALLLVAARATPGAVLWPDQVFPLGGLALGGVVSTTLVLRTRDLQWLSARDKLTGFLNRNIFDDLLHVAALRARRYGRPLSLLMLDVDRFKGFNDTWGHAAGDEALKAVSTAIRQSVRQGEIVSRYGGDEFVVLFPETLPDIAVQRGERIRLRVPPIVAGPRGRQQAVPVTISVGVASLPSDGLDEFEVLNQADMRLYEAKHAGRNSVVGPTRGAEPPMAQADGR